MKPYVRNGYKSLNLSCEGVEKSHSIHRLVAQVFIENQDSSKTVVNHKDGDKSNNDVSNLEWSTHLENAMHSITTLKKRPPTVAVRQLSKDGQLIAVFASIKEAAEATGASSKKIPSACSGAIKTTGGFRWEYVEDLRAEAPEGKEPKLYPDYIVTKSGEVYSKKTKRFLTLISTSDGSSKVQLYNEEGRKDFTVQNLVATLFLDPISGKEFLNHKDGNKSNNTVENLEWVSSSNNCKRNCSEE